jgi:hypothetical protein
MTYIYKHTSPSGLSYIGITKSKNPNARWLNGRGYIDNPKFYCAIMLWGWDKFTHEIIEEVEDCIALEREQYWAEYYNSNVLGYNQANEHPLFGYNPFCQVMFKIILKHKLHPVGKTPKQANYDNLLSGSNFCKTAEEYDACIIESGKRAIEGCVESCIREHNERWQDLVEKYNKQEFVWQVLLEEK